uniref:Knottin scorpion toxin-like domain-containing protein n=1 Tax=Oryza brachyantha TaxID=4533 RepID=J3LHL0_ORYBR
MRTAHFLLLAIVLMSLSSAMMARSAGTTTMERVSALTPNCNSVILYPGKPCDPVACRANCSKMYKGTGTCFARDGCDCVYCSSPSTTASTGSNN